jgi:hypothetical protein
MLEPLATHDQLRERARFERFTQGRRSLVEAVRGKSKADGIAADDDVV